MRHSPGPDDTQDGPPGRAGAYLAQALAPGFGPSRTPVLAWPSRSECCKHRPDAPDRTARPPIAPLHRRCDDPRRPSFRGSLPTWRHPRLSGAIAAKQVSHPRSADTSYSPKGGRGNCGAAASGAGTIGEVPTATLSVAIAGRAGAPWSPRKSLLLRTPDTQQRPRVSPMPTSAYAYVPSWMARAVRARLPDSTNDRHHSRRLVLTGRPSRPPSDGRATPSQPREQYSQVDADYCWSAHAGASRTTPACRAGATPLVNGLGRPAQDLVRAPQLHNLVAQRFGAPASGREARVLGGPG